ncbi:hypothetical protein CDL15_Pgr028465 [Punica granatum]|uniref:Uncharacterized protein n=1 Tax=Punica granatum TaxID=22663 RepID=A0A218VX01_PUNGR|nr:hypothetical protein CDL15_Pgr028465 [Punica granatum]
MPAMRRMTLTYQTRTVPFRRKTPADRSISREGGNDAHLESPVEAIGTIWICFK